MEDLIQAWQDLTLPVKIVVATALGFVALAIAKRVTKIAIMGAYFLLLILLAILVFLQFI